MYCQESSRRIFRDEEYRKAGAVIVKSLQDADIILGVKEVHPLDMIGEKTYLYFSHTHKGQLHNMSSLGAVLQKSIRLLDYELITDRENRRQVLFGKYAGLAGTLDVLHGFGNRMLSLGHSVPFLQLGRAYMFRDLKDAFNDIRECGDLILKSGTGIPQDAGPLVIGITGNGAVSTGAKEVINALGPVVRWIKPSELAGLTAKSSANVVYAVELLPEHFIRSNDRSTPFRLEDYFAHGSAKYHSVFDKAVFPHLTILINGLLWNEKYPKLLTRESLRNAASSSKIVSIADISCDIHGSIEATTHASTIDEPFYIYDPSTGRESLLPTASGIQMLTVSTLR